MKRPGKDTPLRRQQKAGNNEKGQCHDDGGACRHFGNERTCRRTDSGGQRADDGRQKDHRFKTPRPLPCGNGRRDEHGAHEDNAYGLDGKKDGDRGKEREEYIQLAPRKSENCGIVRIKSHKFQFFSEKENQEKGKNRNGSCEKDVAVKNSGCLSENELIQSGLVGISCMLDDGRQHETRAEKRGKNGGEDAVKRKFRIMAGKKDKGQCGKGGQKSAQ